MLTSSPAGGVSGQLKRVPSDQNMLPALEVLSLRNPWSIAEECDFLANNTASATLDNRWVISLPASVTCPEGPTSAPCRFAPSACLLSEEFPRSYPNQFDAESELRTDRLLHSEHRVSFHLSPSFWIHKLQGLGVLLQDSGAEIFRHCWPQPCTGNRLNCKSLLSQASIFRRSPSANS